MLKPSGLGAGLTTFHVTKSTIQFVANGTTYTLNAPDATITFSPAAGSATTSFDAASNAWLTIVPSGLDGNTFMGGVAFTAPTDLPGGISSVTWNAHVSSDTPGARARWQWAAAVYTSFNARAGGEGTIGVKPVDDNQASLYQNSDHAGTPEDYKGNVIGGGRGSGGSNWTGSYSGTDDVEPCEGDD